MNEEEKKYQLESRCKLVTNVYKISRDIMLNWFEAARNGNLKQMKQLYENVTSSSSKQEAKSEQKGEKEGEEQAQVHPLIHANGEGTQYGFIGSTALHWASANGDIKMMKQLFTWGASPNAQNKGGSTPLHSACSNLRLDSVSLLLQLGANPSVTDCCNDTPTEVLSNHHGNPEMKMQLVGSSKTRSIRNTILGLLNTQILAVKMLEMKKRSAGGKKTSWDASSMKKLVVGVGLFPNEESCPKEKDALVSACENALDQFNSQLKSAQQSDFAFQRLKEEFDEKLVEKMKSITEKQQKKKKKRQQASRAEESTDSDDDDEAFELEILSKKAKSTSEKGNDAFRKGEYKLAVQFYTTAISLMPTDPIYFSNRAAAYLKMNVPKKALADAKNAASLNPDWAKPYHRWGCAALDLGQLNDAVAAFQLGLERAPNDPSLLSGLEQCKEVLLDKRGSNNNNNNNNNRNNNSNKKDCEDEDEDDEQEVEEARRKQEQKSKMNAKKKTSSSSASSTAKNKVARLQRLIEQEDVGEDEIEDFLDDFGEDEDEYEFLKQYEMEKKKERGGFRVGGEVEEEGRFHNHHHRSSREQEEYGGGGEIGTIGKYEDKEYAARVAAKNKESRQKGFVPVQDRHPWFGCPICEDRTRDAAHSPCCNQLICKTCSVKICSSSSNNNNNNNNKCPLCGK